MGHLLDLDQGTAEILSTTIASIQPASHQGGRILGEYEEYDGPPSTRAGMRLGNRCRTVQTRT